MPPTRTPLDLADLRACCAPPAAGPISQAAAERIAEVLKALAEPARIRLIRAIAASPGGEACVCDLTEPAGLSQPTVSHHLRTLVEAGLLTREQRTKWAYYRIVPGALATVGELLSTVAGVSPEQVIAGRS